MANQSGRTAETLQRAAAQQERLAQALSGQARADVLAEARALRRQADEHLEAAPAHAAASSADAGGSAADFERWMASSRAEESGFDIPTSVGAARKLAATAAEVAANTPAAPAPSAGFEIPASVLAGRKAAASSAEVAANTPPSAAELAANASQPSPSAGAGASILRMDSGSAADGRQPPSREARLSAAPPLATDETEAGEGDLRRSLTVGLPLVLAAPHVALVTLGMGAIAASPYVGLDFGRGRRAIAAVLCRDSDGQFGISLDEDESGVFLTALHATDAEDGRGRLRPGDYLRSIDGVPIYQRRGHGHIAGAAEQPADAAASAAGAGAPSEWAEFEAAPAVGGADAAAAAGGAAAAAGGAAAAAGAAAGAAAAAAAAAAAGGATRGDVELRALSLAEVRRIASRAGHMLELEVFREEIAPAGERVAAARAGMAHEIDVAAVTLGKASKEFAEDNGLTSQLEFVQRHAPRIYETVETATDKIVDGVKHVGQQFAETRIGEPVAQRARELSGGRIGARPKSPQLWADGDEAAGAPRPPAGVSRPPPSLLD